MNEQIEKIRQIIADSNSVLIIQADNPDADSLASSLALESILHNLGKEPIMYCGVDMQSYLRYLEGWDRVVNDIPNKFDASIIVDTSTKTLLEKLADSKTEGWVASKPVIVLDHHAEVECDIDYANVVVNDPSKVSTGELIFQVAQEAGWEIPLEAREFIMTSILADSLGLTTENTTAQTYRLAADLIESGVSRPKLEEQRRKYSKMPKKIFDYKSKLINQTEFHADGKLALVVIPQEDITEYSPLYNPNPLIQSEHLQTEDVLVSVSIKSYDSGRITAAIRCNHSAPVAAKLAEHFGGGGHAYASGFKINNGNINDTRQEVINKIEELLNEAA